MTLQWDVKENKYLESRLSKQCSRHGYEFKFALPRTPSFWNVFLIQFHLKKKKSNKKTKTETFHLNNTSPKIEFGNKVRSLE